MNALGAPQSLALVGGTSDIGLAVADLLAADRCTRIALAGRNEGALEEAATRVRRSGATDVWCVPFEARQPETHDETVRSLFSHGDVDVALLAFGMLGDPAHWASDPELAVQVAEVNYVAAVSMGLRLAAAFRRQGHGRIVFLSSVAAERGRKSNPVYGSSKAGVDSFAQALGDSLVGTGVGTLVVRPGFVRSRMTEGMEPAPMATTPEAVAGSRRRRPRGRSGARLGATPATRGHVGRTAPAATDLPAHDLLSRVTSSGSWRRTPARPLSSQLDRGERRSYRLPDCLRDGCGGRPAEGRGPSARPPGSRPTRARGPGAARCARG